MALINNNIGILTIVAIILAPVVALQIQKWLQDYEEKRTRKLEVFKRLMATRSPSEKLSINHVQALNMIDIEFYKQKTILQAWNIYRDHLNSNYGTSNENESISWQEKCNEYFVDLLYCMSRYFKYDFDKVLLKKGAYAPMAYHNLMLDNEKIRKGLVDVLTGEHAIKTHSIDKQH